MRKKLTTEEFIQKSKAIHGDKYDYSKVEYIDTHSKVVIICPEHGEFKQRPSNHKTGIGCPKCSGTEQSNTEDFIRKAKEIHGDKYDYSKVNYTYNRGKVIIICSEHGEFIQIPHDHLHGSGCSKCFEKKRGESQKLNTEDFIRKAKAVHGNNYDYTKIKYINTHTKVIIICPEHGEFSQTAANHLQGQGCVKCSGRYTITTNEFIDKAKSVHGDKYDYSKVDYVDTKIKVIIICPEHGEFKQSPYTHLIGTECPKCHGMGYTYVTLTEVKKIIQPIMKSLGQELGRPVQVHDYMMWWKNNEKFCREKGIPLHPSQYYER